MTEAPQTAEGWYVLHDFRSVDWDAWRDAPERVRETALAEGTKFLERREAVDDADAGDSATFGVLGHKADLLFVHLRPTLDALDRIERGFESTAFAAFTDRATSYVSVTEVSGYVSQEYFEEGEAADAGLQRYIQAKLKPTLPDDGYVSFYPMAKRRDAEYNWYDLAFEERADLMAEHGDTGRAFGGKVRQIIASSLGFDDWEWGVTLFAEDPVHLKDIVYEMRFDEGSAKYGEFGSFYVGRRFPPADLPAYMAGEAVPAPEDEGHAHRGGAHHGASHHAEAGHGSGEAASRDAGAASTGDDDGIRGELADLDVYAGQPHGEDVYALVLYSEADPDELADEVYGLRSNFEHYDTHVKTAVYQDPDGGPAAVVSLWETQSAADTAAGFLADLPGVVRRVGESDGNGVGGHADERASGHADDGFGTMGMFYTVKPEHRDDFVEKFETVGGVLADTEGHRETSLLANREDENDMFIASDWDSKDDAVAFFRSDEFAQTVDWGRDVLADRPRHVFLA